MTFLEGKACILHTLALQQSRGMDSDTSRLLLGQAGRGLGWHLLMVHVWIELE